MRTHLLHRLAQFAQAFRRCLARRGRAPRRGLGLRPTPARCPAGTRVALEMEWLESRTVPTNLIVTTTADLAAVNPAVSAFTASGDVSLRSAVQRVDFLGGTNTITLPSAAQPYNLTLTGTGEDQATTGDIDIDNLGGNNAAFNLTIQGGGAATTVIDGNLTDRVFQIFANRTVSLADVTIQNGRAPFGDTNVGSTGDSLGGGILNLGDLTLTNTLITGNQATGQSNASTGRFTTAGSAQGGGIYNGSTGTLTLANSSVTNNRAVGGSASTATGTTDDAFGGDALGGGIANDSGTVQITDTTLDTNQAIGGGGSADYGGGFGGNANGGGFYTQFGMVTLQRNTFSNNLATGGKGTSLEGVGVGIRGGAGQGGGLFTQGDALLVENCTFSANQAVGGDASGSGSLAGVGQGGGIFTATPSDPLVNSTLTLNRATGGNGDYGGGNAQGGGIFVDVFNSMDLGSTIVAVNSLTAGTGATGGTATGPDLFGTYNTLGNNLVGVGDGSTGLANGVSNDQIGGFGNPAIDPRLGPLANNGGPTLTHALLTSGPFSPAIDRGAVFATVTGFPGYVPPTTDQRDTGFSRTVGPQTDVGAYEVQNGSLAGTVYLDNNNNGLFEPGLGETGIVGVTVTLTGTDFLGVPVNLSTTTGTGGTYSFPSIRPSNTAGYTLTETQPAGVLPGKTSVGTTNAVTNGTLANPIANTITAIVVGDGGNGINYNFGELTPASLAGFVYQDNNNNGLFEPGLGEAGIGGVTVTLTGTDDLGGSVNTGTTTSGSGAYSFATLRPGTYTLTETQPAGFLDGKDTQGTPGTGTVGNDVFANVALAAGVVGANNNFGELLPARLAGFVYQDNNNNGVFEPALGETGIAGATVTLTGTDDVGAAVNQIAMSLADGSYSFANLRPGTYTLTERQPTGFLDGKDTQGTPGNGTAGNDVFANITLAAGLAGSGNNFGELLPASLTGFVYQDNNNNGAFEPALGETGIAGATVTLTGTDDLGAAVNQTATTTGGGAYSFANLRPGTYNLTETQPAGFLDGKDTQGTPANGTASNDQFTGITLAAGVAGAGNNFGELLPAGLAGFVYQDTNNNGLFEPALGETGIAGVTVTLTGTDDLGAAVNQTATTGGGGAYSFANLRPGTYTLTETQPAGFLDGKDTQGTPGTGTAGNDQFANITLAAGVAGAGNNFGELPLPPPPSPLPPPPPPAALAQLSGIVFLDNNSDGAFEPQLGEKGLANVVVSIKTVGDPSAVTAADGSFTFTGLPAGTYVLTVTQPAGFIAGKPTPGSAGGTVASNVQITGIALNPGTVAPGYLFPEGLRGPLTDVAAAFVVPGAVAATTPPTILGKVELLGSSVAAGTAGNLQGFANYLNGLYHDVLGRAASTADANFWVSRLLAGESRADVAAEIWTSPEHRALQVNLLYQQFLHRPADDAGRTYWVGVFLSGASEIDVTVGLLTSPEYLARPGGVDAFVAGVYRETLGRLVDPVGRTFWVGGVQAGTLTLADVARGILTSDEAWFDVAGLFYANYLHRPLDAAGAQFWVDELRLDQSPTPAAETLLASDEYFGLPH